MPHLSINFAISADGKISSVDRRPSGWTSKADFERLIELRKPADALLVGRGTLVADQMTMTVPGAARQPLRCIVSRCGKLDATHPIFSRDGGEIHLLVTGEITPPSGGQRLEEKEPEAPSTWRGRPARSPENGEIDQQAVPSGVTVHRGGIREFLELLERDHGVRHVHCEGGGELVRALAEEDLIDEIHLTWAGHTLFGGGDAPTVTGVPGDFLPASRQFKLSHFEPRPETGECFLSWRRIR